jgi:ribosome-binding protein aMBF1 (putative translation factor)
MTSLVSLRDQILSDPEARTEYERLGPIFAVVGEMVDARQSAGLTQAELARRMGTSQSVIARLESARHMPTFNLISRYAQAFDRRIEVHLAPLGAERARQHA